jgi:hypothetical protein
MLSIAPLGTIIALAGTSLLVGAGRSFILGDRDRSGRSDRPDIDFCCEYGKNHQIR